MTLVIIMLNEFWEYMTYWVSIEEMIFAGIGLIVLIVLWILGGKYEKEQEQKKGEQDNVQ